MLAGVVVGRAGVGRAVGGSLIVAAAGLALLGVAVPASSFWWLTPPLVLIGAGIGIVFTGTTDAVLSAVPAERAGSASAISETAFELGAALGVALLGSFDAFLYRHFLQLPAGTDAGVRERVAESLAAAHQAGVGTPVVAAAQRAFVHALQLTSYAAAGLLLVAGVLAWRLVRPPEPDTAAPAPSPGVAERPGRGMTAGRQ
jgi:MFS transporter, DHA2 family, multidrug resistance protein